MMRGPKSIPGGSRSRRTRTVIRGYNELSASEALYGFVAWLSCQDGTLKIGRSHECGNLATKVKTFCTTNSLVDPRVHWEKRLIHPSNTEVKKC